MNMRILSGLLSFGPPFAPLPQPVLCKCRQDTSFSPLPPFTWSDVSSQRDDPHSRSYHLLYCDDPDFPPSSSESSSRLLIPPQKSQPSNFTSNSLRVQRRKNDCRIPEGVMEGQALNSL